MNTTSSLIIRLVALLWLLAASPLLQAEDESPVLMVYGDSLSAAYGMTDEQGWVALLADKLAKSGSDWQVVNGSVSGETSTGGLARLPAMLESYEPDLVILELGGNDGLRGLPLDILRDNLLTMVREIRASGARVILAGIQIPPNYGPRYTVPFFQMYGEIAEQENLPLIPFLIEGIAEHSELMQNDGIHPTAEAQSIILDNVWPVLEAEL
ncbi:MAG: arylesterase [Pseudomonadales bacterium]|nr:arylesterase [Pseudomonadales bacterium]